MPIACILLPEGMIVAPYLELVRKDAAVAVLGMIAVHAEHLKSGRIVVVLHPLIELVTADRPDFFSVLAAIVLYVV